MKKKSIICLVILGLLVTLAWAGTGTLTTNEFIYKPKENARGAAEKALFDAGLDRIDTRLGLVIYVGDPKYLTFAAAVASLNAVGTSCTLILPAGTHTVSADLTVNSNIHLWALKGATLAIATTKTLTINGHLEASPSQIFSCTGTGKVVFGAGAVQEAYLEWWDAAGTNYAAAMDLFKQSGAKTLTLLPGKTYPVGYSANAAAQFDGVNGLVINGNFATLQTVAGTSLSYGYGLWILNSIGVAIRDLNIDGNRANLAYNVDGQSHGVFLQNVSGALLDNLNIKECATDGIYIGCSVADETLRSNNVKINNCTLYRNRRDNISIAGGENVIITGGSNKSAGAASGSSTGTLPKAGINLEPNTDGAAYQNENITILGVEFEANVVNDLTMAHYATDVNIDSCRLNSSASSGVIQLVSTGNFTKISVLDNNIIGGVNGLIATMASGSINGLFINNNKFSTQTAKGIYIDGAAVKNGVQISGNVLTGTYQLLVFDTSAGSNPLASIFNNTYSSSGDDLAADTAIVKYLWADVSNELVYRTGTANSYRIEFRSDYTTARNIRCFGDHVTAYDSRAAYEFGAAPGGSWGTTIEEVWGDKKVRWRAASYPTSGTWAVGATVLATTPAASGTYGWVCTTAGAAPGTAKWGPIATGAAVP